MKKHFLFLAMAVAAMTSCMKDEVIATYEPTPQAIGFESFVNKATKAVTPTTVTDLKTFYVYGYYGTDTQVFNWDNVDLTGSAWIYDDADTDLKYWGAGNTYEFAAYANGNNGEALPAGSTAEYAGKTLTISDYTVNDENDLVAAYATKTIANDLTGIDKVDFTFSHLLTKIQFIVTNLDANYTVRITDLVVKAYKKGDYVSTTGWSSDATDPIPSFTPIATQELAVKNAAGSSVTSAEFFVLPQALSTVTYSMNATFYDSADNVVDILPLSGSIGTDKDANVTDAWAPGMAYQYTIGLPSSAQPIEFGTIGVNGWPAYTPVILN